MPRVPAGLLLLLIGCASAPSPSRSDSVPPPPSAPAHALPPMVLTGPAWTSLQLEKNPRVRVAHVKPSMPVRVREIRAAEVFVEVEGSVRVGGIARLESLAVEVCEPGPLDERFYAGDGNKLSLRSAIEAGKVKVAAKVALRKFEYTQELPFREQFRQIPFEGEIPLSRLCAAPRPPRHAGTVEDPIILSPYGEPNHEDFPSDRAILDIPKGEALELLDAPKGKPLHTFPSSEWGFALIRLRTESGWDQVAAGGGPYVLGWIPTRTPRIERKSTDSIGGLGMSSRRGSQALHHDSLKALPLHRVPEGSVVRVEGVDVARFQKPGFARVRRTQGEWSLVTAAAEDDITVYGWIRTAELGERVE